RDDRGQGRGRRDGGGSFATYRIAVGRRHKVAPRQIVGALANEGGLRSSDFGRIDIRADYSLVELPAHLPANAWEALKSTRISGKLIELQPDRGAPSRGRDDRGRGRDDRPRGRRDRY
ncbi:MAG: DbpA RNA binding domain-containing protein, partial [Propionibacteriaceae bacterium]|nr:DbpA RNA binding domain-containing protein [Propionibacteriaceae bacterium]